MKKTEVKTSGKAKKTTKAAETVKSTGATKVTGVKSSKETKVTAVKSSKETKVTAVKSRKVKAVKPEPTIEEISMKAYEIYNQRISRGETGTQTDDWHKAVELLTKS